MLNKLKLMIRKRVWFYPALISSFSFILAFAVGWFDLSKVIQPSDGFPTLFLTSVDLAKTILSVIAGSLITMTTFTFSTTMVVLTTYASQFSPRTVENFLSDDDTMKVLGVFMGGFVYAIITLMFMRNSLGDHLVVSATIGIAYALVCLVQFMRYIQHVGSYIQTQNLIQRLFDEADENIEAYMKLLAGGELAKAYDPGEHAFVMRLKSKQYGYIQIMEHEKLAAHARDLGARLVVDKVNGQFVTDETPLISLYFDKAFDAEAGDMEKLLDFIRIGNVKLEYQNFNFSIQKIVEIALRAISPGINDPNTARHCLKMLGVLMSRLGALEGGYVVFRAPENAEDADGDHGADGADVSDSGSGNENEEPWSSAAFETIDFKQELFDGFYQIVHYGKSDVSVMLALLKALRYIMEKASLENRRAVLEFLDALWLKLDPALLEGYDRTMLERERSDIQVLITASV
ncbi:DUF2254 domain-containing protein [Acidaminobacter hydrogenoformans]|uniref:Uncharacterized membrane protein n=1 Tax=Acidaminobacter hydrogenoformans DSM 2784 TaxID=1120920 RepID=A0A1G5S1B5_9FIRM|nr:DUF2254 domain-containing protein [Acidaminobacter hydrogenoformans]SCZ79710.1 Uncharacterized membrane protein [Acidaminobacter hydrogenoformans DSM 2784]